MMHLGNSDMENQKQ